ncbi:hypothetical protein [Fodinicola feengrottensis]|uniref:hypothetical protein n=1 Tax=Fodinicola feengrottensis TaxID=435914 RepID=UPI0013D1097C|nr:hypothetical protein [Fodinicola feengrottensis]
MPQQLPDPVPLGRRQPAAVHEKLASRVPAEEPRRRSGNARSASASTTQVADRCSAVALTTARQRSSVPRPVATKALEMVSMDASERFRCSAAERYSA